MRSRWRTDPSAALAAELDGAVVGSNLATRWEASPSSAH
ncbi:hypothetical protein I553_1821 [Mycobacterium xenopi 4042]|uniref:Uncharacterized protein n=1 Tax=Mycobacterium xenopi 4042 TaxID=1299334 RepID=X8DLP1_MYCXE|nr:hypothetical protein I553_1821 [Mycobacterium xenopi 4042]